jgi:hypothetical protein
MARIAAVGGGCAVGDLRILPTLFVAMPFDGRTQRVELHHNRKLYETSAMARSIVTRTKYGAFSGVGSVLIVDLNKCDKVGDQQPDPMARFVEAEERALFWGQEAKKYDDLLHGRRDPLKLGGG